LEMMRSEIAQDKRAEIAAELVKFVTSTEFRNPIQATIRRTVELQEMIQDEAKTHKRLWERRWNHYQNIQRDTSRIQNNIQLVLHGKEPKTLPRPKKTMLLLLPASTDAAIAEQGQNSPVLPKAKAMRA